MQKIVLLFTLILTIGITLCASLLTLTAKSISDSWKRQSDSKIQRYRDALTVFYWPLYTRLLELKAYTVQDHQSSMDYAFHHKHDRERQVMTDTLHLICDKMGTAFPKKHFAGPLLEIIPLFAAGLKTTRPTTCLNIDQLDRIVKLVRARLFTMASRYDELNQFDEEYNSLQLYSKAIGYLSSDRDPSNRVPNRFLFYMFPWL